MRRRPRSTRDATSDGQTAHARSTRRATSCRAPSRRPSASRGRVVGPGGRSATMRGRIVIVRHDGEDIDPLKGHGDRVHVRRVLTARHALLATTSLDRVARIWNCGAPVSLSARLQHQHRGARRAVQPRRALARDCGADARASGTSTDGEHVLRLRGHEGTVNAVAFDPSGRTIADGRRRWHRAARTAVRSAAESMSWIPLAREPTRAGRVAS